ncbi:uncharacterized protein LOC122066231 [Macadamia integrifolia]|uniref:uncharacterized protein LOC122066231 n=1 Tax=Macadamia integrifolia TaxID=60698 RepID=UPI001C4F8CCF|nr:uncharacterized protein LOC122066231 [Macadamia integrifolia]
MGSYLMDFFEAFHRRVEVNNHLDILDSIPSVLNNEDRMMLDAIPSDYEIKVAIWDTDLDNSPSLDGFTGAFFRKCWVVIQMDVCRAVKSFSHQIMASCISVYLPNLISPEQKAFQHGKLIQSNIGLASELTNLMGKTARGGGVGLKIDIRKTFDTISWDFLFLTLRKFDFSESMIGWIHVILKSARISTLLNGGPIGFFEASRGLMQGDLTL